PGINSAGSAPPTRLKRPGDNSPGLFFCTAHFNQALAAARGSTLVSKSHMHQFLFSFSVLILVAALTAACAQSVTAPSSALVAGPAYTTAQLEGTWTLAWIELAGQAKQNRPFDATYTLSFSDGRLSTRAHCNSG